MTTATRDRVLATRVYRDPDNRNRWLRMRVNGSLVDLGNVGPYFSLTCDIEVRGIGGEWHDWGGGADHEAILKKFPKFADLAAMHLSKMDGTPIHAEANGWHWLSGVVPMNLAGTYAPRETPEECLRIFARHIRVTEDVAEAIVMDVAGDDNPRERWTATVEAMRPRWKQEANACIAKHGLA